MIKIKNKKLKGMTFIDLFAGIGGFRLALESLGARCVFTSEWDKNSAEVYFNNFNDFPAGDITKIEEKDVPNHDILCAGFPCQAFSISGKQRGFEDSRGTLFFDVARIVKEKKPKVVFLENVKNFAVHDNGKTIQVVKDTMTELGYTFFQKVLNAVDYGIPQKRERIYMVCFRNDLKVDAFEYPKGFPLTKHVEDFIINNDDLVKNLYINRADMTYDSSEKANSNRPIRIGTVNKGGQGERIYSTKGIAITLSANGGGVFSKTGGYLINGKPRKLHPKECANIMGFPEDYKIANNKNHAYTQFGNSVVVDVLQYIALAFSKKISGEES